MRSQCAPSSSRMAPATATDSCRILGESHGNAACAKAIGTLTDNVLLDIFELIITSGPVCEVRFYPVWEWRPLVRVCHRWREIIFASPLRLDLQLLCMHGTPVRNVLDFWPPTFPIAINYGYGNGMHLTQGLTPDDKDNLFAALEQRDRVRHLALSVTDLLLEEMATLMQEPFPELKFLAICPQSPNVPVLPDHFLGGSAPRLREIWLNDIPFPALPTLLSSASDLVKLVLDGIPQTGYISPAAFAACLAVLPRLEHLSVVFQSPAPPTDRIHLPLETRAVLPSLASFVFRGDSAYLEVIMALVDTPQLDWINVAYTDRLDFWVTEFPKFIERSFLKPSQFGHAKISFGADDIRFDCFRKTDPDLPAIAIRILSSDHISELVFDMAELLNQTSAMLSDVFRLEIRRELYWRDDFGDDLGDGTAWLELFRPFKAVKKLHVCEDLVGGITHALKGRSGDSEVDTLVLPSLKSICVEDENARDMRERRERGRLLSNDDEGPDSDDCE
ncbi:hypothetical protein EDB89DRAFT_1555889 [Lactarius sanguifluus]|nr:hypothetical protein EDB89DRAFT_1555889 [Lactarius sanguifluus]